METNEKISEIKKKEIKPTRFGYIWKTYLKVTTILIVVFILILWIGGLVEDEGFKTVFYISIILGPVLGAAITLVLNSATKDDQN
jgi:hypothetical protein